MKRPSIVVGAIACGLCTMLVVASVMAQDESPRPRDQAKPATAAADHKTGKLDTKTTEDTIRASQLIGMNIENSKGESVGEINDLVLDANSGKVRYAAVTYGGFLGVGNKMFAVPFEAFRCERDLNDPNDPDDYVLVLDVTQQQLEGAEGFDKDHWPNFANRSFTTDLDKRYRIERRTGDRDIDVDVNRDGVDVNVDKKPRDRPE
ncbi:MAG: PRC-barrel domain-containing protein [Pirellulales bacterium]